MGEFGGEEEERGGEEESRGVGDEVKQGAACESGEEGEEGMR